MTGEVAFPASDSSAAVPTVGFVPQQDILPAKLTVYEAILFAARLRLLLEPAPVDAPLAHRLFGRVTDRLFVARLERLEEVRRWARRQILAACR